MARPHTYTKQIGIRCDEVVEERCEIAGDGAGVGAGARRLIDLGWQSYSQAVGRAGASRADRLRAIAAELDQEASAYNVAPSGSLMVGEPTSARIRQARDETGAALITTKPGILLFGLGADGEEACFALDAESGVIGITTRSSSINRELGNVCPSVAALAQLLAGVLARTAETVSLGKEPTAAPAGRHERLGLTVWGAHPDDGLARLQIGEAWVAIHSLQLTALCSELFALQARMVADAIGRREQLEAALRKAPSRAETELAWSRTHGD